MSFVICKKFDCQHLPSYHQNGWEYEDERNLCSQLLRLFPRQQNDSVVEWPYLSMLESEISEIWFDEDSPWPWKKLKQEAIQEINYWLLSNGALPSDVILINYWW